MSRQDFERVVDSIREEDPGASVIQAASERVRASLEMRAVDMGGRLNSCEDFRALADAYREGTLTEARHMLVEDHLHSCVACRRFFRGEQKATVVTMPQKRSMVGVALPWAIAAMVLIVAGFTLPEYFNVLLAPSGPRASVASVDGEIYRVAPSGLTLLTVGAPIAENEQVRTAKDSRAVLKLRDGSLVEVAERSDLRVSEGWRRKMVTLERGSVMVEAAKQSPGRRLEISTPDCLVSVHGTIFSVSRGMKGSRVSVVEGEVKVDKSSGTEVLHRGDQTATNATMLPTTVAEDVSWSANSPKYLELLGEFSTIQKKLSAMPGPAMRYSSRLTGVLPANTAVFVSMPNLASTLAEANSIFEERAKASPALAAWWNAEGALKVRKILGQVQEVSGYLGDEIVIAVPANAGVLGNPVMVAEAKKAGIEEYFAKATGSPLLGSRGSVLALRGGLAVVGDLGSGGFEGTSFGKRVAESYASGAGWLFAADMEQILSEHVRDSKMENLRYVVLEKKDKETSATVSFAGTSWIAAPAAMGTLDFVSPEATFAASFVINNPAAIVSQMPAFAGMQFPQDIASTLGGEVTVAVDGPLLPTPSWKVAVEVNNPARLEWSIEQMVKTAQQQMPEAQVLLTNQTTGGSTFYTLSSAKSPISVNYVFTDGYLLMAPNRGLLESSISGRVTGNTLANSTTFRAQLPQNGRMNFSALAYYNASVAIAPMAEQLTQTRFLTDAQKKALAVLTADRKPTLIYAYAEKDRIVAATLGSFEGLGLDALVGLSGGADGLFTRLMSPALGK